MSNEELVAELEAQRALMVSVATGGPRIEDVDDQYKQRRVRLARELASRGLQDPSPFQDLWGWYGKWSSDIKGYQPRREYLANLFRPVIEQLTRRQSERASVLAEEPTGWDRVDRAVDKARTQLDSSSAEEDFQRVGLLCREILISLAQAVYDPALYPSLDGTEPSSTDGKRMLEAYIAVEMAGGSNAAARTHARAALELANALQHRRTASFREAALCAEAATSVVNIIAIVSGRRDPDPNLIF
jgi:hypothetical protein